MLGLGTHKMRGKRLIAAVAVLVTIGAGTGVAAAAGVVTLPYSGDGNTINGCYSPGGQLKLVTAKHTTCPSGMTPIHWNVTGPQGPAGTNGTNGNTVLSGTTVPASTLGAVGDFYLDTSSPETLYGPKTSTGWPSTGTGLVGPQGAAGTNGNTILSGTTAPASTLGAVGDFYLDTSSPETLYGPKTSTGWPSTGTGLVGPQGPPGVAGITYPAVSSVTISAHAYAEEISVCPPGDYAISGYWHGSPGFQVFVSTALGATYPNEWSFEFKNTSATSMPVSYGVVCAQVG